MARAIELMYEGKTFSCEIDKVERKQLYGFIDIETTDPDDNVCRLETLSADGRTLIASGGTALGYVDEGGQWLSRADLVAVNMQGTAMNAMPSSFKQVTEIDFDVRPERYLDHKVRLCYRLLSEDIPAIFMKELTAGKVFQIPFSYRGGVDPDTAFILMGDGDIVWMLVGDECDVEFVGLDAALMNESGGDDETDEDDGLDFGMM